MPGERRTSGERRMSEDRSGTALRRADETGDLITNRNALKAILEECGSAVVALSGGVDSATLAVFSHLALKERSLAVTGVSASLSGHQQSLVERVLGAHPMPHEWLATDEMASEEYRQNGPDRCFHCKNELYRRLRQLADERGFAAVLDGTNADDAGDVRPGRRAATLLGVRSPWLEAGISKETVRALARSLGLPVGGRTGLRVPRLPGASAHSNQRRDPGTGRGRRGSAPRTRVLRFPGPAPRGPGPYRAARRPDRPRAQPGGRRPAGGPSPATRVSPGGGRPPRLPTGGTRGAVRSRPRSGLSARHQRRLAPLTGPGVV